MSAPICDKGQKLFERRAKAATDRITFHKDVTKAVKNAKRRVHVERLVTYCEEALAKALSKNEQLHELAQKTSDLESVNAETLPKTMKVSRVQGSTQTSAPTLKGYHNCQIRLPKR